MRHLLFLFIPCFFLFSCSRTDLPDFRAYPGVMEVAKTFDNKYHPSVNQETYIGLAKKPGGWFVVKLRKADGQPVGEQLFWSLEKKQYVDLPPDFIPAKKTTGQPDPVKNYMRGRQYQYDHSVYFGYDGWENDAINVLENAGELSDTLLEALGRAYEEKCNTIVHPKGTHAATSVQPGDDAIKQLIATGKKEIATYKKLQQKNPAYHTIVGRVDEKMANAYLFIWSELDELGHEKEAEDFLPDSLYDPSVKAFARTMLDEAEPNGIIFTAGDNDTYPLWYMQEKYGYRKDVAVLNSSLVNVPGWLFHWKKKYHFNVGLPQELYRDSLSDITYAGQPGMAPVTLEQLREGYVNKQPQFFLNGKQSFLFFPSDILRITYDTNDTTALSGKFTNYFITKGELATLDVIASNVKERPLYFALSNAAGTIYHALSKNLTCEGLLVRITPGENRNELFNSCYYDREKLQANFSRNKFSPELGTGKSLPVPELTFNYCVSCNALVHLYLQKGDTATAGNVLDDCLNTIPVVSIEGTILPCIYLGEDCFLTGKEEKGAALFGSALQQTGQLFSTPEYYDELGYYISLMEYFSRDCERFHVDNLRPAIETLKRKLEDLRKQQGN